MVRVAGPYFYLCSSTINFHCGTKPNELCHHTSPNFDGFMIRFEGLRKKVLNFLSVMEIRTLAKQEHTSAPFIFFIPALVRK
jgi:hypothetical protein